MKTFFVTFSTFLLLLTGHNGISQSYSPYGVAPTCYSCCDGSWTITLSNCPGQSTFNIVGPNVNQTYFNNAGVIIFNNICLGQYTISMLGGPLCNNLQWSCAFEFTISISGLERQNADQTSHLVFPNPTTDKCFLKLLGHKTIEIMDPLGNIVRTITTDDMDIDLSELKLGIYYLNIYSDKGFLVTRQKVIRN